MAEGKAFRALAEIDRDALESFQAGIRKRYSDEQVLELARRLGRLPKFSDWTEARKADESLLTEWQVYRMFDARRGAWSTFQFLIRERLRELGVDVAPDGRVGR